MHDIEPFFLWRDYYKAENDKWSPFYQRQYDEFSFTNAIYNYVIHPQWDDIGSDTLFIKILYVNYDEAFAIIEMIGEWNDCIGNDIMFLKRDILDIMIDRGVRKFILIAENVLNFHYDMDDYYAELYEDVEQGWVVITGLQNHVAEEMKRYHLDHFLLFGEEFDLINWRTMTPENFYASIKSIIENKTLLLLN
ncbi:MAG TPA: hypothetical protein P5050_06850 [Bacteroidia bacterium]|mgnify:CR=1 FL=1|nr:hypothetical protein [Bacteroidia bacterium]HRS58924.1 hypothetical protein [Bacteroidia bacterium]HRU68770.1 hypothetical protein [Bacteroidia bacterium]